MEMIKRSVALAAGVSIVLAMMNPGAFTCSKCKGTDTSIVGGRQATVKSMRVDD